MADFTVDIDGLRGLLTNLERTQENIDSATKRLADLGSDSIGTWGLNQAYAEFRDDWDDGLGEIEEAVGKVQEGLSKAIKSYADIEEGITESLRKMREELAGAKVGRVGSGQ